MKISILYTLQQWHNYKVMAGQCWQIVPLAHGFWPNRQQDNLNMHVRSPYRGFNLSRVSGRALNSTPTCIQQCNIVWIAFEDFSRTHTCVILPDSDACEAESLSITVYVKKKGCHQILAWLILWILLSKLMGKRFKQVATPLILGDFKYCYLLTKHLNSLMARSQDEPPKWRLALTGIWMAL